MKGKATSKPKYPVKVQLTECDGNSFFIIALVRRVLRRAGASDEEIEAFTKEAQSGDYDQMLQTCMKWVEVE